MQAPADSSGSSSSAIKPSGSLSSALAPSGSPLLPFPWHSRSSSALLYVHCGAATSSASNAAVVDCGPQCRAITSLADALVPKGPHTSSSAMEPSGSSSSAMARTRAHTHARTHAHAFKHTRTRTHKRRPKSAPPCAWQAAKMLRAELTAARDMAKAQAARIATARVRLHVYMHRLR